MNTYNIVPIEIRRLGQKGVSFLWSNGDRGELSSEVLRKNCPCAACREARGDTSHATPLSNKKSSLKIIEHTRDEELDLQEIWQVGNYAIGLRWGDGHSTGIYTFKYLRELA